MNEAGEGNCIYAIILTDTWDRLQKGSNDTEMRPYTESYTTQEASKGYREQEWCNVAYPDSSILYPLEFLSVRILGAPASKELE